MYPRTGSSERSPRRWVSPPRRTRTSHLNQGDPGDLSAWAIASFLSPLIHRSAWNGAFCELRLNGVLGSLLPASNHKQRQRYDVCGMCQNARSWYSASQQEERSEAPKYAPQKVGTHGV